VSSYLLLESRDPFSCNDVPYYYRLAQNLRSNGNDVTLFLVQNGVLPARRSAESEALSKLADAGVTVLADEFSLRERGIATESVRKRANDDGTSPHRHRGATGPQHQHFRL
jgi:sulfur relay (sulfurtransferase) complex TusBCD TusD component (DsrE family)